MPRPLASVAGRPSTAVPITGTRWAMAVTAVCDQASRRDGTTQTDAPLSHGRQRHCTTCRWKDDSCAPFPADISSRASVVSGSRTCAGQEKRSVSAPMLIRSAWRSGSGAWPEGFRPQGCGPKVDSQERLTKALGIP